MDLESPALPAAVISPNQRRHRPNIVGEEVTLSDGQTWLLAPAGVAPILSELRDGLYDDSVLYQKVPYTAILQAAWVCLLANYNLTDAELSGLLTGLSDEQEQALATATMNAIFGSGQSLRTYTDWAVSALYANGLNPANIPASTIPHVLNQLVRTGRAVPESDWVTAGIAAEQRKKLFDSFKDAGIKATPYHPVESPSQP